MSNKTLLEKVVTTTGVAGGGGGLLNTAQTDQFIDYMWDATTLVKEARKIRMRSNTADIDKIGVGSKLLRLATEAVDDHVNADAVFSKISITTKKLRLDWELSSESLEDNIEGADLETHIARMMATAAGNDLEDLAINGDTSLSGDPLYKAFDGWRKLALAGGHVVDAANAPIAQAVFNRALKNMPRKYKARRNELRFYTGAGIIQDWLFSFTNSSVQGLAQAAITGSVAGPDGNPGGTYPYAFGIPIKEVPMFKEDLSSGAATDNSDVWLTFPGNLVMGVKREIEVYNEFKPKKDTIEYTLYTRVGVQIENLDAFVVVKNNKVGAA